MGLPDGPEAYIRLIIAYGGSVYSTKLKSEHQWGAINVLQDVSLIGKQID